MGRTLVRTLLAAAILFGTVSVSQADFADPGWLDNIALYAVDDASSSDPGAVTLSVLGLGVDFLEYKLDNTDWMHLDTVYNPLLGEILIEDIPGAPNNRRPIWFRFDQGGGSYLTGGYLLFMASGDGPDLWNSVGISFGEDLLGGPLFSITANNDDDVSQVPVPAALLLLGSGLVGLIAMKRKEKAA